MRKSLALFSALALLALPFFFAYMEAERPLGWSDGCNCFDSWLVVALLFTTLFITLVLFAVVDLYTETS